MARAKDRGHASIQDLGPAARGHVAREIARAVLLLTDGPAWDGQITGDWSVIRQAGDKQVARRHFDEGLNLLRDLLADLNRGRGATEITAEALAKVEGAMEQRLAALPDRKDDPLWQK